MVVDESSMGMGEVERRGMEAEDGSQGDGVAARLDELACGVRGQDFPFRVKRGLPSVCMCLCVCARTHA